MAKRRIIKNVDAPMDEDRKWRCESDLRTLKDVYEILNDKQRMADVKKEIANQKTVLDAVEKIDTEYLENIGFKKA